MFCAYQCASVCVFDSPVALLDEFEGECGKEEGLVLSEEKGREAWDLGQNPKIK